MAPSQSARPVLHPTRCHSGLACLAALLMACAALPPARAADGCRGAYCAEDAIFQAVPLQSLTQGLLESPITLGTVLARGDFGLGGLAPLDGEVIVVDGTAWHARLDGSLRKVASDERTAALFVKRFRADRTFELADVSGLDALARQLDAAIGRPNRFHAVRIDGRFDRLRLRSVPRQSPPYRSVVDVVTEQNVIDLAAVEGTLVGFRFPAYLAGVNAEGYHFHFVDRARRMGGHVLDVVAPALEARIDSTRALTLVVPDDPAFDAADFSNAAGGPREAFDRALRPSRRQD